MALRSLVRSATSSEEASFVHSSDGGPTPRSSTKPLGPPRSRGRSCVGGTWRAVRSGLPTISDGCQSIRLTVSLAAASVWAEARWVEQRRRSPRTRYSRPRTISARKVPPFRFQSHKARGGHGEMQQAAQIPDHRIPVWVFKRSCGGLVGEVVEGCAEVDRHAEHGERHVDCATGGVWRDQRGMRWVGHITRRQR